ncbi:BspA family leucine-rich repeat surface protein [Acinetobacter soli]|uniref:BspA family leucine-rich repeat surface protein n=1 Tax=Acinetobacter soli TaxID=487316 RepID=UPI0012505329|nr:BspA family leucine-rich repeat surface protein [Acinetobacter soli]
MSCTVFKSTNAVDQSIYAFPPAGVLSQLQVKRNLESATGASYDFKFNIRDAGSVTFKATGGTLSVTGQGQFLNEITINSDTYLTFTLEEGREFGYIGWTSNYNIIGLDIGKGAYPNYVLGLHSEDATTLFAAFSSSPLFNQPLNNVDVSNIVDFAYAFSACKGFNRPLSKWDTSKGTDFTQMFIDAENFNQPIDTFKMGSAVSINGMLSRARKFNQPLNSWDVSKVTDFAGFLNGASSFNQPLTNWNTVSGTNMAFMLAETKYNHPIYFNTSKVVNMEFFLWLSRSFNQPINIDVGMCKYFGSFFFEANAFNQDISDWNIRSGEDFSRMFYGANAFDQDLSKWCNKFKIQSAVFGDMFNGSGLSVANYDKFLNALWLDVGTTRQSEWANRSLSKFLYLEGKKYSQAGAQARSNLIGSGWSITDGGQA